MRRTTSKQDGKAGLDRVLVVEDDSLLAMAIQDALEAAGVGEVTICASVACALRALEESSADAIVLDVHLTDRDDGWALAELVAMLGPKPPRIVFSTASPDDIPPEIAQMGLVFEKPYDPAQLAQALIGEGRRGLLQRLRGSVG